MTPVVLIPAALLVTMSLALWRARREIRLLDISLLHLPGDTEQSSRAAKWLPPRAVRPPPPRENPEALRVVLFSDLHAEHLGVAPESLIAGLKACAPDMILFAGDLADRPGAWPTAHAIMCRIAAEFAQSDIPLVAVRGNHDQPEWLAELADAGWLTLSNEARDFTIRGTVWRLIGLDYMRRGKRPKLDVIQSLFEGTAIPARHTLALSHNPDSVLHLPQASVRLFLAGHFHGGQIWLPFHLEFLLLRHEKLAQAGHHRGYGVWRRNPVYISRGIGCVSLPLRLFSKPELTVFEIDP